MKRLSVVVLLALVASILFSSSAFAGYSPAKGDGRCDALLKSITTVDPLGPKFERDLQQAAAKNCGYVMDRGALIAMYYRDSMNLYGEFPGWLTDPDHCTWSGISCTDGRVTSIDFGGRLILQGPIPPEIGYLSELVLLDLSSNFLSGSLPAELGNLSKLQILLLYWNRFTGPIPPELGNLQNLTTLSLYRNSLSGSIPSELGNLSSLQVLALNRNDLSGKLPDTFLNYASGNVTSMYLYGMYPDNYALCIPDYVYYPLAAAIPDRDFYEDRICQ